MVVSIKAGLETFQLHPASTVTDDQPLTRQSLNTQSTKVKDATVIAVIAYSLSQAAQMSLDSNMPTTSTFEPTGDGDSSTFRPPSPRPSRADVASTSKTLSDQSGIGGKRASTSGSGTSTRSKRKRNLDKPPDDKCIRFTADLGMLDRYQQLFDNEVSDTVVMPSECDAVQAYDLVRQRHISDNTENDVYHHVNAVIILLIAIFFSTPNATKTLEGRRNFRRSTDTENQSSKEGVVDYESACMINGMLVARRVLWEIKKIIVLKLALFLHLINNCLAEGGVRMWVDESGKVCFHWPITSHGLTDGDMTTLESLLKQVSFSLPSQDTG